MASIRVTKAGRFEARRWAHGQRVSKTFNSKAEALHWASQSDALLENHLSQLTSSKTADKRDKRVLMTLEQALEIYGLECVSLQKGAKKAFYRLRELQKEPFAKKLLPDVCADDLRGLKARELARGCSGPTVARKLSILSAFFNHAACEWGLDIENPTRFVRKPPGSKARVRRLLLKDEETLMKACRESKTRFLVEVVELAIETGMRRGELINLCWEDVDFNRHVLTLSDSKNGYPRYIPLTKKALMILRQIQRVIDRAVRAVRENDRR
jgi:integrase